MGEHNVPEGDPRDFTQKDILVQFVLPKIDNLTKSFEDYKKTNDERVGRLEGSVNKMKGGLILIAMALIPLSVPVVAALANSGHHG